MLGSSLVFVAEKEGYAWNLNVDGHIHTEEISSDLFTLGFAGKAVEHNTIVKLVSAKEHQSEFTLVRWSFSTPVFGKRASSTTTTTASKEQTQASITESIEQGATIDAVETVKVTPVSEKHHDDHHEAKIIAGTVAAGAAAAGAIAAIAHHQHKDDAQKQSQTSTTVTTGHSTTTVTVTIEEIKVTIYQWFLRYNGRVSTRLQQGGDNVKADVERLAKEAREELTVIIKESKTKAQQGWTSSAEAIAELDVALNKVQTSVLEQVTEVETVVKETTKVDEATHKLTLVADKAKSSIHTHLDHSTSIIHGHINNSKVEGHHHAGAITAGVGATIGGAIAVHEGTKKVSVFTSCMNLSIVTPI